LSLKKTQKPREDEAFLSKLLRGIKLEKNISAQTRLNEFIPIIIGTGSNLT